MIDAIIITTGKRDDLLRQTIDTMLSKAIWLKSLTVVIDGLNAGSVTGDPLLRHIIFNTSPQGASASRNIGASSIPKYRRQSHVMFCDDDCYFVPGWDKALMELSERLPSSLISGHSHPFNHGVQQDGYIEPLVISTVNFLMPWELWDDVGFFTEPGGPGGSEDYDWCQRAKAKDYGFAVSDPHMVIHCGLISSSGKKIVGHKEMTSHNDNLLQLHNLNGKVIYS